MLKIKGIKIVFKQIFCKHEWDYENCFMINPNGKNVFIQCKKCRCIK